MAVALLVPVSLSAAGKTETIQNANTNLESGARDFVNGIYSNYQVRGRIFDFKGPGADTIFCPRLLQLILLDAELAQGEVGYLESDPLCSCQDAEGLTVNGVRIEEVSCDTFAFVDLGLAHEQVRVAFKLSLVADRWCVADVRTQKMPSLFGYLFDNLVQDVMAAARKK